MAGEKSPPPKDGVIDDELCPFCKLKIIIDAKNFTIQHARPICTKFDQLEPYQYLMAVRRQVQTDLLTGEVGPLKVIKRGST